MISGGTTFYYGQINKDLAERTNGEIRDNVNEPTD